MGLLDSLIGHHKDNLQAGWKALTTEESFEELLTLSEKQPVLIFKHSIRCGISAMVKHQLERDWDFAPEELTVFFLDLISYRAISNAVSERLNVVHQSPQVILVKNREAVYATSHHMISVPAIHKALEEG